MRHWKEVSAALGSACLAIAVAEYLEPGFVTELLPFDFEVNSRTMKLETSSRHEVGPVYAALPEYNYTYLDVQYISPIMIGNSVEVVAKFSQEQECFPSLIANCNPTLKKLPQPIEISLRSDAFEIDKVTQSFPVGWPLPISIVWAVLPKMSGNHKYSLDVSKVHGDMSGPVSEIKINGKKLENTNSANIPLDITIHTGWGIPQWLFNLIGVIGAVLITPTVTEVIKKIVHREKTIVNKKSLQPGKGARRSRGRSRGVP
jgi:hypothetical protein